MPPQNEDIDIETILQVSMEDFDIGNNLGGDVPLEVGLVLPEENIDIETILQAPMMDFVILDNDDPLLDGIVELDSFFD